MSVGPIIIANCYALQPKPKTGGMANVYVTQGKSPVNLPDSYIVTNSASSPAASAVSKRLASAPLQGRTK